MRARRKCVPPRPVEYTLRHSRNPIKEEEDPNTPSPDTTSPAPPLSDLNACGGADSPKPQPIVIKAEADLCDAASPGLTSPGASGGAVPVLNGAPKKEPVCEPGAGAGLAADAGIHAVHLSAVTWQLFQQEKSRVNSAMNDSMFVHWLLTNIRPSAYFQHHYRAAQPHQPVMSSATGVAASSDAAPVPNQALPPGESEVTLLPSMQMAAAVGGYGPSAAPGGAATAAGANSRLFCAICRKHFSSRAGLIQHQRGMHAWQPHFRCNKCGQRFRWASQLHDHRRKGYCPCVNLASTLSSSPSPVPATGASMVPSQMGATSSRAASAAAAVAVAPRPPSGNFRQLPALSGPTPAPSGASAAPSGGASGPRDLERDLDCASSNSPVEDDLGDDSGGQAAAAGSAVTSADDEAAPEETAASAPAPVQAVGAAEGDMEELMEALGDPLPNGEAAAPAAQSGPAISCPECAFSAPSRESLELHFKSDHVVEDLFSCTCGSDFPCLSLFLCHYIGCPIAATDLGCQGKEAGGPTRGGAGKEAPGAVKAEDSKLPEAGVPLPNGLPADPSALAYAGLPGYPAHPAALTTLAPPHRLAMSASAQPPPAGSPYFHVGRGMGRHEAVVAAAAAAAAASPNPLGVGVAVGRPRAPNGQANCQFCHQTFSNKNTLKQHIIGMHSHEAQYHCEHCGKAFRWAPSYYTHRRKCGLALRGLGPSPRGRGRAPSAAMVGRY